MLAGEPRATPRAMRASVLLALTTLLAACSRSDPPPPASTPASTTEAPAKAAATTPGKASAATPAAPGSAAVATAQVELKEGDPAPGIDLPLQDGRTVKLSSFAGKSVAIYFYPKDNTPGCTVEAQGLRDQWAELQKAGVEVIGVSTQDAASHKAFIEQEKLPFPLAIDTEGKIAGAFGVPLRNGMAARHTFLIGKDGKVRKVWRQVSPKDHAAEILAAAR